MQSGRTIYYQGNTVNLPRPSEKNRERRRQTAALNLPPTKIMADVPRVCAALRCPWCGSDFDDYKIICPICAQCVYCGYLASNSKFCHTCNNELPPELDHPEEHRTIIVS